MQNTLFSIRVKALVPRVHTLFVINIEHLFSLQKHHQRCEAHESFNNEHSLRIEVMAFVNSYNDNEPLNITKHLRIKFSLPFTVIIENKFIGKNLQTFSCL